MSATDHTLVRVTGESGALRAECSCGWMSRKCRTFDGPQTAWMNHLDREMPRT